MQRSYQQTCPIARSLDLVGDRWTLLILRDMLVFGKAKFSDFQEQSPRMPVRTLSERLKVLEAHGLVERRIYSQHPLRAAYHPTSKAIALKPVLSALADWGLEYLLTPRQRAAVEVRLEREAIP